MIKGYKNPSAPKVKRESVTDPGSGKGVATLSKQQATRQLGNAPSKSGKLTGYRGTVKARGGHNLSQGGEREKGSGLTKTNMGRQRL